MLEIFKKFKYEKFHVFLFLTLVTYSFAFAQSFDVTPPQLGTGNSNRSVVSANFEEDYANATCSGGNNIIRAGCSLLVGQVVRTVPSMVIGYSFSNLGACAEKIEKAQNANTITIDRSDPCFQLVFNFHPLHVREKFLSDLNERGEKLVFAKNHSILSAIEIGQDIRSGIQKSSFTPQHYAQRTFEKVPFLNTAFAATGDWQTNALTAFMSGVWGSTRNIAFLLVSVFSILLGIGIMTSGTINQDPRLNITLEQAIPKVIIAIILINMSYFIGYTVFEISENRSLEGIVRYIVGAQQQLPVMTNLVSMGSAVLFASLAVVAASTGLGLVAIFIPFIVVILIYVYQLAVFFWRQFTVTVGIVIVTIFSPFILALSVLPGQAGDRQIRSYFSSILSLFFQAFFYQFIWVLNTNFLGIALATLDPTAAVSNTFSLWSGGLTLGAPIIAIILMSQAARVNGLANQLAQNLIGEAPLGAQNGR